MMPINVLVVDDSAYSRYALTGVLESIPGVKVVSTAIDGLDAYRQALRLSPDLIMLDLEMPVMDGFTFLRLVGPSRIPVIVVTARGWEETLRASSLGAFDFIEKPPSGDERFSSIRGEIERKLTLVPFRRKACVQKKAEPPSPFDIPEAIAIGASTGGPRAISSVVKSLPAGLPSSVIISLHMPGWLTGPFAERLEAESAIQVEVARDGARVEKGSVIIAPGESQISFVRKGCHIYARITKGMAGEAYAPSINRMFSSAARAWGPGLTGIVMTGLGADGAEGVKEIKERGGYVIAQSEETSAVPAMPRAAVLTGRVDEVLPSCRIAAWIAGRCRVKPLKMA